MRRAAKRDDNEGAVIKALRMRGHLVQQLSQPGVPDLLVGVAGGWRRFFRLLEVKGRRNKRGDPEPLEPLEAEWHAAYKGWPVFVVTSPEEAIAAVEDT